MGVQINAPFSVFDCRLFLKRKVDNDSRLDMQPFKKKKICQEDFEVIKGDPVLSETFEYSKALLVGVSFIQHSQFT